MNKMTTDECRLILNIIDNVRLIAESTDFVTQHPLTRETVSVIPEYAASDEEV